MTYEKHVEELKIKLTTLQQLLENPEYGCASWVIAVGTALDSIAEHAPGYVNRVSILLGELEQSRKELSEVKSKLEDAISSHPIGCGCENCGNIDIDD